MGADTKHLLSLNGAAIFILLLSAAMYTRYPMVCARAFKSETHICCVAPWTTGHPISKNFCATFCCEVCT